MPRRSLPLNLANALFDVLLPPRCPSCRAIVAEDGAFCGPCWAALAFVTEPLCARCGLPFPYAVGDGALCGACAAEPPPYHRARAAVVYNDASAALALGLKYGDRTQLARVMAAMMARAARAALAARPLIVPVPLHPRRLRARRFNQSALIARALARLSGAELAVDALERTRDSPPSRGLSRAARADNVRGTIRVSARRRGTIAGRHVLVVDDVMTTGATVEACARALRRAGASLVDIVTFARVTHH